jgi:phage shock protein PspC (stress-responsive transcriptional regulator)
MTKTSAAKRFTRSSTDKVLAGVCGGLGAYFEVDSTIFRIIFVVATFFGGFGLLLYIILALLVPAEDQEADEPIKKVRSAAVQVGKAVENTVKEAKVEMEHRRGDHSWAGLVLVLAGILFLLANLGFFRWADAGRFWPILLILLGLFIVAREDRS